jgi:hypothetical protein
MRVKPAQLSFKCAYECGTSSTVNMVDATTHQPEAEEAREARQCMDIHIDDRMAVA